MSRLGDPTAERALVAAALHSPSAVEIVSGVPLGAFTDPAMTTMAAAIQALAEAELPVDEVTLAAELSDRDQFDAVGGHLTLTDIVASLPAVGRARVYANRIVDLYARRLAVELAESGNWPKLRRLVDRALELTGGCA